MTNLVIAPFFVIFLWFPMIMHPYSSDYNFRVLSKLAKIDYLLIK